MRIVIATGIFPPDIGGPATYSALLAEELPKRGIEVRIVTYGPAGVSRSIPKGLRHLIYFFRCFFAAIGSDIVFAQDPVSAGLPALIAARLAGAKFIIRIAGDYAWEQAMQRFHVRDSVDAFQTKKYSSGVECLRNIQKYVAGHADRVITPSNYFRELVGRWVREKENVVTIYNGIDLKPASPTSQGGPVLPATERERGRTELRGANVPTSVEKRILSAGRLVPWKGFAELIGLMPKLPDWKLTIVGDGPERTSLEAKVRELKLENRVTLLRALPREDLLRELGQARVFVLNTSFESFSFQVVEAMHAGVPVVSTSIGNLSEIIENGKEGILVEPNDANAITSAITKLDRDAAFRAAVVESARAKAGRFSIQATLDSLEQLFKNL